MQRAPPAASTTQQLCVTGSTPTAFDASWPSASTLACKGFAAWGCVSPLPAPSYQQSEKFTRALRRKLRPSDAALLVVPVPGRPCPRIPGPGDLGPGFRIRKRSGPAPKGPEPRSDRGRGGAESYQRGPLISRSPACVPQGCARRRGRLAPSRSVRHPQGVAGRAAGSMQAPSQRRGRQVQGIVERQPDQVIRAEHGHAVSCAGLRS